MKKHHTRLLLSLCIVFIFLANKIQAQTDEKPTQGNNICANLDVSTLELPEFEGHQNLKGLITISLKENNDVYLTRQSNKVKFKSSSEIRDCKNSLWWVMYDYIHKGFALVSVSDVSKWVVLKDNKFVVTNTLDKVEEPLLGIDYIAPKYFFEFQTEYANDNENHSLIRSIKNKKAYVNNSNSITIVNGSKPEDFYLHYEKVTSMSDSYLHVPVYTSRKHKIRVSDDNTTTNIKAKKESEEFDNTSIVGSGYVIPLEESGDEKMFKVTFTSNTVAEIGLLDNRYGEFAKKVIQDVGSRKAISGIGIEKEDNKDKVYLFVKSLKIKTDFTTDSPIFFGYIKGKLVASQGDKTKTATGVPTGLVLNISEAKPTRLLSKVYKGEIDLSYRPSAIIINKKKFGAYKKVPERYNTDPYFSFMPVSHTKPNRRLQEKNKKYPNTFNWYDKFYNLKYEVEDTKIVKPTFSSPFYPFKKPYFESIGRKVSAFGDYMGGEDFSNKDGWELIKVDFGYRYDNTLKAFTEKEREEVVGTPYMVLYNRFTGKLRVFVLLHNTSIANGLAITLKNHKKDLHLEEKDVRVAPTLWQPYLKSLTLEEAARRTRLNSYTKGAVLNTGRKTNFYYVDFQLNYDPCVCIFDSSLQVIVGAETKGNLKITGKTIGGSIPASDKQGIAALGDPKNFLTGALNGDNKNSLGDISFTNFKTWGAKEWSNKAQGVMPGKKVPKWKIEAAKLQWEANATMASGEFVSASSKLLKAAGKAGSTMNPFSVFGLKPEKAMETAGELMDAKGTFTKASGRAMAAHAMKLRYDGLRNSKPKSTKFGITMPTPQPSVVFSELAASGTLTIQTPITNDILIRTPGSLNAHKVPNDYITASNGGSAPVYNEPLGVFSIMYNPSVTIKNNILHFKEQPYIAVNTAMLGIESASFTAAFVISVSDKSNGRSIDNFRTKSRVIAAGRPMPQFNISKIINKIKELGITDIDKAIENNQIAVDLEVEYVGSSGVDESGNNVANIIRQSAHATIKKVANANDYEEKDNELWGSNYIISSLLDNYKDKLTTFCTAIHKDEIDNNRNTAARKANAKNIVEQNLTLSQVQTKDKTDLNVLSVYPNPSSQIFNVRYLAKAKGKITIQVIDMAGKVLLNHNDTAVKKGEEKEATINLQSLVGVYILRLQFANGESLQTKLLKK